jgi:Ca2+-binding RTX toxin-like protein
VRVLDCVPGIFERAGVALFVLALVALELLLMTSAAQASEVSVHEASGEPNTTELNYTAAAGEDNQLKITIIGNTGLWQLDVVDPGAAIKAATGCTGGGAIGTPAHCQMHPPKWWDLEPCGKVCTRQVPGSAWFDSMQIALGDGTNSFDGSAFGGTYTEAVDMHVTSGAGDDRIITGGGEDVIDPGPGSDVVKAGEGFDEFIATTTPDGPDIYESGPVTIGRVNYSARTTPVELHGTTAGAPGENDSLVGAFAVLGGSNDDVLEGNDEDPWLEGGPGDDVLIGNDRTTNNIYGGPGDDHLTASGETDHLVGEEGNDVYQGGPGTDIIRDAEPHERQGSKPTPIPSAEGGNDLAHGGGGNDAIGLGVGNDRIYGGPGDDRLDGASGVDIVAGNEGDDRLIGGRGFDHLYGGANADTLFSGRWESKLAGKDFPFEPVPDDGPDMVGGGSGHDVAVSNPWDTVRTCEVVHRVRPKR